MSREFHHLAFPKKIHEAHPATLKLRRNKMLIPPLESVVHFALHKSVTMINPLDGYMANSVARDFEPVRGSELSDYLKSIDEYLLTVARAGMHWKCTHTQKLNAELHTELMSKQIPFIKEGFMTPHLSAVKKRAA